jgi:hypothetical protein
MRIIPTYLHGAFDYICGFALILGPNALGFAEAQGPERLIPQLVGLFILVQSLMTRYECGVLRVLSMSAHRLNEALAALFLTLSPWVFDFHYDLETWIAYSVMGSAIVLSCLLTSDQPRQVFQPSV